jgi:ubiquinone/menaquinone biosynthesis C-methylase UbiE
MSERTFSLTDSINSEADLKNQYKDSSNLSARASIYRFGSNKTPWPSWVFDQLLAETPQNAAVLEVGCGPGGLWKHNLGRMPSSWRVTLTDLMPGMIDEARASLQSNSNLKSEISNFRFEIMDVQNLALLDASFDTVIANHMLYHVPDLPRGLSQIRRVLRPGGKLIAATNSEAHMLKMKQLAGRFMGSASPLSHPILFSLDNGPAILRSVFQDVQVRSQPGQLRVTDPEAVVQYILSIEGAKKIIVGPRLDELRKLVMNEIQREGAFVCATESGLFIAS